MEEAIFGKSLETAKDVALEISAQWELELNGQSKNTEEMSFQKTSINTPKLWKVDMMSLTIKQQLLLLSRLYF